MNRLEQVGMICALGAGLLGAAAMAQYALDANLGFGIGGRNMQAPALRMGSAIYTVNSGGGMSYDRAVAFRDDSYRIYQSHTIDRFRFNEPQMGQRRDDASAASLMNKRAYDIRHQRPTALQSPSGHSWTHASRPRGPNYITPERSARQLRQPSYSAIRAPLTARPQRSANRLPSNRVR